ncbi:MAG: C45 family peptidase [Elioraea sp.]|nr:C45 family peptidase [Elioraea sp.]
MSGVILLEGDPYSRGLAQARACPEMVEAVRRAVRVRLSERALDSPAARAFLAAQGAWTERHAPEAMAEIRGIAAGFGLGRDDVFAFLHAHILADLAAAPAAADGCSAFARSGVLAKNRDVRPDLSPLQRLFLLRDPAWGKRSVLALGSLGAPGAYSSGMNSDGLAVADTQIPTIDHGRGILRYLLMNRLLATCSRVTEALAAIAALPQAGGGALVIADATGAVAAAELRYRRVDVERGAWVARTNHYTVVADRLPHVPHSDARLAVLRALVAAGTRPEAILAHRGPGEPLCRPAGDAGPTIAGAIWETRAPAARIAFGPPAAVPWRAFRFADGEWRETHA